MSQRLTEKSAELSKHYLSLLPLPKKVPNLNVLIADIFRSSDVQMVLMKYIETGKVVSSFSGRNMAHAYQSLTNSTIDKITSFTLSGTNPPVPPLKF